MKEVVTSKGTLKLKHMNVLELVKLRGNLVRKLEVEYNGAKLSMDDYGAALIELLKDHFDFSGIEGIDSFEKSLEDIEIVQSMIELSLKVLESIGEVSKKKN